MALQFKRFLSMVGMGIESDAPPDALQPPLVDGVHLRWQFGPERGFPWHGYYLYRRHHIEQDQLTCVRPRFEDLATNFLGAPHGGSLGTLEHEIPEGRFLSDEPLLITDDFPPDGFAELDLRDREQLSFRFSGTG